MRENLGEQLTVDDMARSAMFSKFHFTRLFQRVTGVSPGRFLSALRLQRAKELLLSTDLNVADISLTVGYNSVGTFSSRFTRSVGMPPTTYRRRAGYAAHIAVEHGRTGSSADSRVFGKVLPTVGAAELVFIGLFRERIPEGRPARCAVLLEAGSFQLDRVPSGTWYLLAQAVTEDPGGTEEDCDREPEVLVATHGPLTIRPDTATEVDLMLAPVSDLDPPVLLALLEARKAALARAMSVEGLDAAPERVRAYQPGRAA
ncbi:AraC family transcriptional regulator [Actinoplanes siamensis]|uniref:AraC family transcriptional regulator n=2 Tax=Actinoplanes siamensis TaxID=1223317 RepID=A0A919TMM5_9ACTN|nr:AraC family transcriptional regulator [Actinoplanes siamensis]